MSTEKIFQQLAMKHTRPAYQGEVARANASTPERHEKVPSPFQEVFKTKRPLIGMIHFPPLVGYGGHPGFEAIRKKVLREVRRLNDAKVDAIMVENNYDEHTEIVEPEVAAMMSDLTVLVVQNSKVPVGISFLWNDYRMALDICKATGASFIRVPAFVDSVDTVYGHMPPRARDVVTYRKQIGLEGKVAILADVQVKHSEMADKDKPLSQSIEEAIEAGADAVIVTGTWTGVQPKLDDLEVAASYSIPVLIGSGSTVENLPSLMEHADGAIVGTAIMDEREDKPNREVDSKRLTRYVRAYRKVVAESDKKRTEQEARLARLREVFELLARSSYEGVSGVIKIEGGKPGPTLGITVCTHGDEPAGLAAAEYVLTQIAPEREQLKGNIFIVLSNPEATRKYFDSTTKEVRRKCRFIKTNLNRRLKGETGYEADRARELTPILAQFDAGMDIHSTTQKSRPMIIALGGEPPMNLIGGMPIRTIISNIDAVQVGKPLADLFGPPGASIPRFGIEAGSHEDPKSFEIAVACAQALIHNLGMFTIKQKEDDSEYEIYKVFSSIIFPNESYRLTELFKNFQKVDKDTELAFGDGDPIRAPKGCITLFARKLKPDFLDEEVMFLAEEPSVIRV